MFSREIDRSKEFITKLISIFLVCIVYWHCCRILSIANKESHTLFKNMLKLPFNWLAFFIHSDKHLVHTVRIFICSLITRFYIPIVGTLTKCFRIRTCKSQLACYSHINFRASIANAISTTRTIHLLRLTKRINTHHLSMSSKRSRNLYLIYSITISIIPLLLELEHCIIIGHLVPAEAEEVSCKIVALRIDTTRERISISSLCLCNHF